MKKYITIVISVLILITIGTITVTATSMYSLEEAKEKEGLFIRKDDNTFIYLDHPVNDNFVINYTSDYESDLYGDGESKVYKFKNGSWPTINELNSSDELVVFGNTDFKMYSVSNYGYTLWPEHYYSTDFFEGYKYLRLRSTEYTEVNGQPISTIESKFIPRGDEFAGEIIDCQNGEVFEFGKFKGTKYETKTYIADAMYYEHKGKKSEVKFNLKPTKNGYFIIEFPNFPNEGYYIAYNTKKENLSSYKHPRIIYCKAPEFVEPTPKVFLNGVEIVFDQPPIVDNGRTLVPIRAIAEKLGSSVSWEQNTQTAIIQRGLDTAVFQIGLNKAYSKSIKDLDVPSKIINGRTLVPLRAISEIFGATVNWNPNTYTVNIECETLLEDKIISEFTGYGFLKFAYFRDSFVNEHLEGGYFNAYAWSNVISNIGDWGKRVFSLNLGGNYKKDCYKNTIETIVSKVSKTNEYNAAPDFIKDILSGTKDISSFAISESVNEWKSSNKNSNKKSNIRVKAIEDYADIIGKTEKTIKWGDFTLEELTFLLTDYTQNIAVLDIIENAANTSNDDDLKETINNLKVSYKYKWIGVINDTATETLKGQISKIVSEKILGKASSLYDISTFALETIGNVSGMKSYSDNVESAVVLSIINNNLIMHFDTLSSEIYDLSSKTIYSNITDEQWDEYKLTFEVTKASMIEMYKFMTEVTSNSAEKLYLEKQIDVIDSIHISNEIPSRYSDLFYIK